ncbi:MAG TPA: glycosyltransferase family 39 protein [Anaerolineae bacterium]|nr:glycosyltransferase family 39 protein [Anaerolineae bacterium]
MKPRPARWLAVTLLLLQWALLLNAATRLSATIDEPFHITSGYEYLRTGNVQLFDEHPPLAKALFAWPLFFVPDLAPPETANGYADGALITVAQETLLAYRPLDRVIVAPRIAAALLTVLLAATIYHVAATLAGPPAGVLALALCALDPNFLAHGSLATTDMGATAFSFWALWAGTRWLQRPTRRRWGIAALLLGLAQGVKLTALLLYPVLGVGVVINAAAQRRQGAAFPWKTVGRFVAMAAVSALALWALYGFELRPVAGLLGGIPLPAASHIERWLRLQENLAYGREAFLLGQNSMHGWWTYFPVAFALKTPLPLLLLGLYTLFRRFFHAPARPFPLSLLPLLLFPALYVLSSLTSTLNIGYRHLLPALPFVYIGIGVASARSHADRDIKSHGTHDALPMTHDPLRIPLYALLAWLALGTLRLAPNYLTFFNEIAGGPENGWRFLADSNTDWGQAYKALAAYQEMHDLKTVQLSTFTFYDPAAYGVSYVGIAPMRGAPPVLPRRFNPEAGIYAISATTLDGVPLPYPPTFDWFRHREPFAKIGYALFLYEVQPLEGTWMAQCSIPVAPLNDAAIDAGFGIPNLRRVTFDCEQSWVLPSGGVSPGWFARAIEEQTRLQWPTGDAQYDDLLPTWISALPMKGLKFSYLQSQDGELPAFALWECAACHVTVSAESLQLGGILTYQGLSAPKTAQPGTTITVTSFWKVLTPPQHPLSIMLHLRSVDGALIAVGDGLGFPVEQWQKGDLLAQYHSLIIPQEITAGEYRLYTGAYWLETLVPLTSAEISLPINIHP